MHLDAASTMTHLRPCRPAKLYILRLLQYFLLNKSCSSTAVLVLFPTLALAGLSSKMVRSETFKLIACWTLSELVLPFRDGVSSSSTALPGWDPLCIYARQKMTTQNSMPCTCTQECRESKRLQSRDSEKAPISARIERTFKIIAMLDSFNCSSIGS